MVMIFDGISGKGKLRKHGRIHSAAIGMLILSVLLVMGVLALPVPSAHAQVGDWSTYLGDLGHSGYNGLETIINPSTVQNLIQHWSRTIKARISTQPIVANGMVYWGSWDGIEHASNLSDGTDIWTANLGQTTDCKKGPYDGILGVLSTATVATETINGTSQPVVYVGGGDNNLYALNANLGTVLWKLPLGSPPTSFLYGSPAVYNGSVYIGVSGLADCVRAQGQLVQVDASLGTLQHTFDVVPSGCLGGSVWTSPTIDQTAGTLYFVTSESSACKLKEKLALSLVELNVADLSFVSSWAIPKAQRINDGDSGSSPTLFQATIGGTLHQMVGFVNKSGIYYAFDRASISSGPLWQVSIATAPGPSTASSAWDGTNMYVAAGETLINGANCPGSLNALNPATGAFLWQVCLDYDSRGGLMVVPGLVELGVGNSMMIFGTANGALLFSFQDITNGKSDFLGPGTISNGVLYQGNMDGKLYAFGM
jgi:outer membrane protein assembly factor BamB